tara:strand:+ start:14467 stop:15408 length:942 start_codon:yes stop_codon:yes gene_type:complete
MTVSNLGQANATGADDALFLQVFAGDVLEAFEEVNTTMGRHTVRTIESGKSASFPSTWQATAAYHTPGNQIIGDQIRHNERVINIDDLLVSSAFIADLDDAKNHFDVRRIYSAEVGRALSYKLDENVLQVGVLASRAAANITGAHAGTAVVAATAGTDGSVMQGALFDAAQAMDEHDVPATERYAFVKPAQYHLLGQTSNVLNAEIGGMGSIARAQVPWVADLEVVKTNHLPTTDMSGDSATGQNNTYLADFSNVTALAMHSSAVGTVKLLDLSVQMTSDEVRAMWQGTLIVARYALGHGILRPESAVSVTSS